jgi:hypothetical protein
MPRPGPRYSEAQAREAIAASLSYSDALRRLGMRPAGGNHRTIRRYAEDVWRIPVDHFDPAAVQRAPLRREPVPLEEVLVEGSRYQRAAELGYTGVGRRYGVSATTIRKWRLAYEREHALDVASPSPSPADQSDRATDRARDGPLTCAA